MTKLKQASNSSALGSMEPRINGAKPLKIAFLAPVVDFRAGGIATVVDALCATMRGAETALPVKFAPERGSGFLGAFDMGRDRLIATVLQFNPDVVHTHGLWVTHARAGAILARRHGLPEVVSPHGMLDPWAMANHVWKKKLAWAFGERRHLQSCGVVHALCESELESIRALGIRTPIAIIPNGVNLPAANTKGVPPWSGVFETDSKVLLFLGRMHPKKGVGQLIRAWAMVAPRHATKGWRLALIGWDDSGYASICERLIRELGIIESCRWFGAAQGEAKTAALANARAFILPSFSEGLPMTVLEAWSHRLPVFMTMACNLPEGFAAGAAVAIDTDPKILAEQLFAALSRDLAGLQAMGLAGHRLVADRFTWSGVAERYIALYRWMCRGSGKPSFVATE